MEAQERTEFVDAYTRILTTAWSSEEYSARLESNPEEALREQGLEVPAGATVAITRQIPDDAGDPSLDVAVGKWEAGKDSGTYVLSVPDSPQLGTEELSEADLMAVAAGVTISHCCCTPCCCCT